MLGLYLNSFVPNAPFLYHQKTVRGREKGLEKECIGNKWVKGEFIFIFTMKQD